MTEPHHFPRPPRCRSRSGRRSPSTGSWCSIRRRWGGTCSIRARWRRAHWPTTWSGAKSTAPDRCTPSPWRAGPTGPPWADAVPQLLAVVEWDAGPAVQHRAGRRRSRRRPDRHAGEPGVLRHPRYRNHAVAVPAGADRCLRPCSSCCGPAWHDDTPRRRLRRSDLDLARAPRRSRGRGVGVDRACRHRSPAARRRAARQLAGHAALDGGGRVGWLRVVRDQHHPARHRAAVRHPARGLPTAAC